MHPMKLLFISPAYEPAWSLGGVVACMSNLCRGLASLGHEVTFYTTNVDGNGQSMNVPVGTPVDLGGVRTLYFPSTFNVNDVRLRLFDSRALRKLLKRTVKKFDIVYLAATWQWIGIETAKICWRAGVPMVFGVHGDFAKSLRSRHGCRKKLFYWLALRRALKQTSAFHLTTESELHEGSDWLADHPQFVVPNAIDTDLFHSIPEKRCKFRYAHSIPAETPVLITVGRPDWKKRVDFLIQALKANPEWYLLIVGPNDTGMAAKWSRLAAELKVSGRVVCPGFLAGEELLAAYSAADLFALISMNENFGMVVVEALLCDLPVLVSPEVGVWEMLENSGVGEVVQRNAERISVVLKDFTRNPPKWENRAAKARQEAIEQFSMKQVAALMATAFQDILLGRQSGACRWYNP